MSLDLEFCDSGIDDLSDSTQSQQYLTSSHALGCDVFLIYWKKTKLTAQQKKIIDEMLRNLAELERINQQILFLAEHFKDHTIDKIMGMEDVDLAISYLTGKLYPPTGHENYTDSTSNKNKSFKLPPDVICQKKAIKNSGTSYTFRHKEW